MKIYINSRGRKQDYHWHEISARKELPLFSFQNDTIDRFDYLISKEELSILLVFVNNELLLLITALQPEDYRVDSSGTSQRIIRNSIVLVSDFTDEYIFRSIAISALRGELAQKLEDIIEFDDELGFRVTANSNNLLNQLVPEVKVNNLASNLECESLVKLLSNENREQLTYELQSYRLPKREGILVIVTERGRESDLRDEKVWRGLTPRMITGLATKKKPTQAPSINDLIRQIPIFRNVNFWLFLVITCLLLIGLKFTSNPSTTVSGELPSITQVISIYPKDPLIIKANEPFKIEGHFSSEKKKDNNLFSNLIQKINKPNSKFENISADIDDSNEIKGELGTIKFIGKKKQKWSIDMKKGLSSTGDRSINIFRIDKDGNKVLAKSIPITVVDVPPYITSRSSQISCTVGLHDKDLNVFLIGDKIKKKKDQLKVLMRAGSKDDYKILDPTTEIANLLKYQNVDGKNAPKQDLTYIVLASYNLEEEEMKQRAIEISKNQQNCQTIATGNPCVVCFKSSK